jgi:hypothetical protein
MRGSLIHNALSRLLSEAPSQQEISRWSDPECRKRIARAVGSSLDKYTWYAEPVLRRILELERGRLCDLLSRFIEAELARPDFQIENVEHEIEFRQFGTRLRLRVDRIDRLPDGSLLIADYKSGQPKNFLNQKGEPHDLQLVVYASALGGSIGGLVLINIDSRSIIYKGIGASVPWDSKRAGRWPERLAAWQEIVARAMQQIARGDIRLNLDLPGDKTRPLSILSRIEERRRG